MKKIRTRRMSSTSSASPNISEFLRPLLSHMRRGYCKDNYWDVLRDQLLSYNLARISEQDDATRIMRFSKGCYVLASYILGCEFGVIFFDEAELNQDVERRVLSLAVDMDWTDKVLSINDSLDLEEIKNLEGKVVDRDMFRDHMTGFFRIVKWTFDQGWFKMSDFYSDMN